MNQQGDGRLHNATGLVYHRVKYLKDERRKAQKIANNQMKQNNLRRSPRSMKESTLQPSLRDAAAASVKRNSNQASDVQASASSTHTAPSRHRRKVANSQSLAEPEQEEISE